MSINTLYLSTSPRPALIGRMLFFSFSLFCSWTPLDLQFLKSKSFTYRSSTAESSSFQIILPIHLSLGRGQFMKWELDILCVCFIFCWKWGTNYWLFRGLRVPEWRPGLKKSRFQQIQGTVTQSLLGRNSKWRNIDSWWLYYKQISSFCQCR